MTKETKHPETKHRISQWEQPFSDSTARPYEQRIHYSSQECDTIRNETEIHIRVFININFNEKKEQRKDTTVNAPSIEDVRSMFCRCSVAVYPCAVFACGSVGWLYGIPMDSHTCNLFKWWWKKIPKLFIVVKITSLLKKRNNQKSGDNSGDHNNKTTISKATHSTRQRKRKHQLYVCHLNSA